MKPASHSPRNSASVSDLVSDTALARSIDQQDAGAQPLGRPRQTGIVYNPSWSRESTMGDATRRFINVQEKNAHLAGTRG